MSALQRDLFHERLVSLDDPEQSERLNAACQRVRVLMSDGAWHGRDEIERVGGSEGLRRFRQVRSEHVARGGRAQKRHEGGGLWSYRLLAPRKD